MIGDLEIGEPMLREPMVRLCGAAWYAIGTTTASG